MATFPDLASFDHWRTETSSSTLTLTIRGHEYTWRAGGLSMWAMLKMRRLDDMTREYTEKLARDEPVDETEVALTTAEQKRLDIELLGDNLAAMTDDGVKWDEALHVSATLLTWYLRGQRAAMDTWARKPEEDKPADPPARAASTTTGGSSTTRKPTAKARSGGGTSSRTGAASKRTSNASTKSTSATKTSAGRSRRAGS